MSSLPTSWATTRPALPLRRCGRSRPKTLRAGAKAGVESCVLSRQIKVSCKASRNDLRISQEQVGGGNGNGNGGGGSGHAGGGGGDEGDERSESSLRALAFGLGAFAVSSLALSLVEESGEEIPSKNVARAADVPEVADIVSWLKDLTSGLKARNQPQVVQAVAADEARNLLIGKGSTVAGLAFAWKTLLCWCSEDVELASTATDLGFLSFIGCFSLYAISDQFRNTRAFLLQAALSHIFLETVFEFGVVKKLDPQAKPRISWDMVIHHIGSLATGIYCTQVGGGKFSSGDFLKQGARLACTEITTGFPVAFKSAIKNKKFKGKRRLFFAVAMPVAFIWRTLYTLDVLKSYLRTVDSLGGRKAIPSKWLGATCFGSVVGCNMYWTGRILSGVVRTLTGKGKLGKKGTTKTAKDKEDKDEGNQAKSE